MEKDKPTTEEIDFTKKRLEVCVPMAREIFALLNEVDLGDTSVDKTKFLKSYEDVALKVIVKMLRMDLKFIDRFFIFQLVKQGAEMLEKQVVNAIEESYNRASTKRMGADYRDLTLKQIDNILKEK